MKIRLFAFAFRWLTPPAFDRWYIRRLERKIAAVQAERDGIEALAALLKDEIEAASLKETQHQRADGS